MDVRESLLELPDPPVGGEDRVWARFRRSRMQQPVRWVAPTVVGLALAAAGLMFALRAEPHRVLDVQAGTPAEAWSPTLAFEFDGVGTVTGTSRDVQTRWSSGTLRAEVTPASGTRVAVVTEEARVEVIGTVFSVTRDRLGTTTRVERGQVRVTCQDGQSRSVGPDDGPSTCAPTSPAGLLARADALLDAGADPELVRAALDAGVASSEAGSAVRGELLVRRMSALGAEGRVSEALADAHAYLDGPAPRAVEVHRYAGWLAWGARDCATARHHLDALGADASAEDRVLLAECLTGEVHRARALLDEALPHLDPTWAERARAARAALETR
jgi:hypothetical protein